MNYCIESNQIEAMFFQKRSICAFVLFCIVQPLSALGKMQFWSFQFFTISFQLLAFNLFTDFTLCHLCDSIESPQSCLYNVGPLSTCLSEFKQCYTLLLENVLYRGCVSATDVHFPSLESIEKCSNSAECEICKDADRCNRNIIVDTCIKCNESEPISDCRDHAVPCSLEKDIGKIDGCYLNVANNEHGCMRNLNVNEQIACETQSAQCQSCKYPNCNRKEKFSMSCYECNGEIDSTCAQNVELAEEVRCDNFSETCVTGIDSNGLTHRGCISYDLLNPTFPLGFDACAKHLCNKQIFPADRLRCYQCEGTHECVTLMNLKSEICNNYKDQLCYAYLENSMRSLHCESTLVLVSLIRSLPFPIFCR